MSVLAIKTHYCANRQRLVKRLSFRAGTAEAAEDVVQEAYYRALKYRRSFSGNWEDEEAVDKWFATILNNSLREYKNIERGHPQVEYVDDSEDGEDFSDIPVHVMRDVYELIDTKTPVQQEVLRLFFHQDYSAKDIAAITEYSYTTCHQIIQRFRNELKELYR